MRPLVVHSDGTALDLDGNALFISYERFTTKICQKGHCFVCGAAPHKSFNDEHIFPNWLLHHCGLHDKHLSLPNDQLVKYANYKIPCCEICNSLLGKELETPVGSALKQGYDNFVAQLDEKLISLIASWLCLIFVKVHLRDFKNRVHLDRRMGDDVIGDQYDLGDLHHAHAVARAIYCGAEVDGKVFGSLVVLKLSEDKHLKSFDYCDNLAGRGILIQVNDIGLIYIVDDCGATSNMLSKQLEVIPSELNDFQLREIYARYVTANIHIKSKPEFYTNFLTKSGIPIISVNLPEFDVHEYVPEIFGNILAGCLGALASSVVVDGKVGEDALEVIRTGRVSFLFDGEGKLQNGRVE